MSILMSICGCLKLPTSRVSSRPMYPGPLPPVDAGYDLVTVTPTGIEADGTPRWPGRVCRWVAVAGDATGRGAVACGSCKPRKWICSNENQNMLISLCHLMEWRVEFQGAYCESFLSNARPVHVRPGIQMSKTIVRWARWKYQEAESLVQKPRNITKHTGSEIWLANVGEAGVSLRFVGTNARRNGGSRLCKSMQIVGANAPVQSDDMPKSIFGCISPRPCRKKMKVLTVEIITWQIQDWWTQILEAHSTCWERCFLRLKTFENVWNLNACCAVLGFKPL